MQLSSSQPPRPKIRLRHAPIVSLRPGDDLAGFARVDAFLREDRGGVRFTGHLLAADSRETKVEIFALGSRGEEDATEIGVRFLAAARRASALEHPNVARVLRAGVTADGHPYVITEHVTDKTLADLALSGTTFSTEHAVDVALEVCDALSAAHALGIFHAGLSPSRVHIALAAGRAPKVKVAGFGDGSGFTAIPFVATDSHLPAPEQLRGRTPDARCDVWGVGVLLYTMLAGAPPFASEDAAVLDEAVAREEHASLAGVPDALAVIVDACLAKDSSERPASIAALADELAPFSATRRERASTGPSLRSGVSSTPSLEIIVEAEAPNPAPPAPKPPPPAERPQMRSVAPVAINVAPPAPAKVAPSAPAPSRSLTWIALAAAACLAAVVIVARRPSAPSAAAPSAPETATQAPLDVAPSMELNAPPPSATAHAAPTATQTTSPSSIPSATAKAIATAKPARATPAATATSTSTTITATPVATTTPATPQPEPKASDDDLRRYLDDRR
jgi:serine/threonine-protein kinase